MHMLMCMLVCAQHIAEVHDEHMRLAEQLMLTCYTMYSAQVSACAHAWAWASGIGHRASGIGHWVLGI